MKPLFICIFILFFEHLATAQVDSSNYMVGNVLYEQGNYSDAIIVYENVIRLKGKSAVVNYNLGNAYYKSNQIGKSILNYERALELNPGDGDIRHNLDLAILRIRDQLAPVDEVIFAIWWRNIYQFFTSTMWAYISIFLFWVAVTGFAFFRFSKSVQKQKTGFYSFIAAFLLFIFAISAAYSSDKFRKTHNFAIVMVPSAILKSEPNESSINLTYIHEGLKVQILQNEGEWAEIRRIDGNVGWLMNAAIEEI